MSHTTHQGTVAAYDEATRAGSVVDDNGHTHEFNPGALSADVRLLRLGQRVHWRRGAGGEIVELTLVTLSL